MMDSIEMKRTAPIPSVGADGEQPIPQTTALSITEEGTENNPSEKNYIELLAQMQRISDPAYLPTVSLNELYQNVYQGRPPVIDGLLYPGTYLFAGAPKVGKSFLVAQLAYHVSTGQSLWDHEIHAGTVLYLALEDDYPRLQERMFRMFGVEGTDKLHFAVYAKQIGNGLDEQLEKFVEEHPDTRLIVIDTLQKIREMGGEAYSYADDYQIVGRLKQFADRKGLCLLVVHHTRKTPSGDKFEMISGTTGLLGCADGAFILQKENRTDSAATLDVVGRDQPDQRVHLVRDEVRLIWEFDHVERELWKEPPDPLLVKLSELVTADRTVWSGTATELVDVLGSELTPIALAMRLNVRAGKLMNDYGIWYENSRTHAGRTITLTLINRGRDDCDNRDD